MKQITFRLQKYRKYCKLFSTKYQKKLSKYRFLA